MKLGMTKRKEPWRVEGGGAIVKIADPARDEKREILPGVPSFRPSKRPVLDRRKPAERKRKDPSPKEGGKL